MDAATGAGVMVSVTLPLFDPIAAATSTVPAATPVTVPFCSTVAIDGLLVDQMKAWPVSTVPAEFVACAVSSIVLVAASVVEGAVTVIAATALRSTTGGGGGGVGPSPPPPQDRSAAAIGADMRTRALLNIGGHPFCCVSGRIERTPISGSRVATANDFYAHAIEAMRLTRASNQVILPVYRGVEQPGSSSGS